MLFAWDSLRLQSFFFFIFSSIGFELRASCLLGRWATTWATLPALFCFGYFWNRVSRTICLAWRLTAIRLQSSLLMPQEYLDLQLRTLHPTQGPHLITVISASLFFFFFFFWWYWGLNSGLYACYTGTLPLEPQFQPCFVLSIFKICLGWPHLNLDLPKFCLLTS
jgi:hypothetical protein